MRSHLQERVGNRVGEEGQQLSLRPWLGIPLPPRAPEECQTLNSHFLKPKAVFTPAEGEISQIASGECAEPQGEPELGVKGRVPVWLRLRDREQAPEEPIQVVAPLNGFPSARAS